MKRTWFDDILECAEKERPSFTLNNMYKYEKDLRIKHPNNYHIKAKIRQQLQQLRDLGIIKFDKPGAYSFIERKR